MHIEKTVTYSASAQEATPANRSYKIVDGRTYVTYSQRVSITRQQCLTEIVMGIFLIFATLGFGIASPSIRQHFKNALNGTKNHTFQLDIQTRPKSINLRYRSFFYEI